MSDHNSRMPVPDEISSARLLLRPWRAEDAADLHPILATNWEHLGPWIPARVAEPAPIPILAQRLAGFAADFAANREWRYALVTRDEGRVLGEVGLFPRSATGRAPFGDSDRAELGYWLRSDETGRGFITEAARAVLAIAANIPRFSHVEIRCDARNTRSAAVPRRLGFALTAPLDEADTEATNQLQIWTNERRT